MTEGVRPPVTPSTPPREQQPPSLDTGDTPRQPSQDRSKGRRPPLKDVNPVEFAEIFKDLATWFKNTNPGALTHEGVGLVLDAVQNLTVNILHSPWANMNLGGPNTQTMTLSQSLTRVLQASSQEYQSQPLTDTRDAPRARQPSEDVEMEPRGEAEHANPFSLRGGHATRGFRGRGKGFPSKPQIGRAHV